MIAITSAATIRKRSFLILLNSFFAIRDFYFCFNLVIIAKNGVFFKGEGC